jgi:mRNA-degrading endonuclease RelE of RelBE toxin-antitoxin system
MRFVLEFSESALENLSYFRKYEQTLIVDQVEVQLSHEPAAETRNRKPLEPNTLADWELRIGVYRVFYDVDATETKVKIKAVGYTEHNRLFIGGKEYVL